MLVRARACSNCMISTYPDALSETSLAAIGTGVFVGIADQAYQNCCIHTFWAGGVHPYIATGLKKNKFGIPSEEIIQT